MYRETVYLLECKMNNTFMYWQSSQNYIDCYNVMSMSFSSFLSNYFIMVIHDRMFMPGCSIYGLACSYKYCPWWVVLYIACSCKCCSWWFVLYLYIWLVVIIKCCSGWVVLYMACSYKCCPWWVVLYMAFSYKCCPWCAVLYMVLSMMSCPIYSL